MSAIPANPAYRYGFGMGTRCHTCTHTHIYPWAKPGWVLKPMPITIYMEVRPKFNFFWLCVYADLSYYLVADVSCLVSM